jgi:hypothetical protein
VDLISKLRYEPANKTNQEEEEAAATAAAEATATAGEAADAA